MERRKKSRSRDFPHSHAGIGIEPASQMTANIPPMLPSRAKAVQTLYNHSFRHRSTNNSRRQAKLRSNIRSLRTALPQPEAPTQAFRQQFLRPVQEKHYASQEKHSLPNLCQRVEWKRPHLQMPSPQQASLPSIGIAVPSEAGPYKPDWSLQ